MQDTETTAGFAETPALRRGYDSHVQVVMFILVSMCLAAAAWTADLSDMDLEDLMNVQITSVSKKPEAQRDAAAAIYVLTQEDIRRSGATTLPDLLRLVPGVSVAVLDSNKWSVTVRGFGGRYANKLLVLIDGRSVYTPLFSGVEWSAQDLVFEDIERIEVIRGPGGALWGSNAVNGVINIITKHSNDTQGGLLVLGAGTEDRALGVLRYGDMLGDNGAYRLYAKYLNRDGGVQDSGRRGEDEWQRGQLGFRMDWELDDKDRFTLQGGGYVTPYSEIVEFANLRPPNTRQAHSDNTYRGLNLNGRWERDLSGGGQLALQAFYDFSGASLEYNARERHTFDIELEHHFAPGDRHDISWGLGFRYTRSAIENRWDFLSFDPADSSQKLFSAYVQDQIALVPDRLILTLGAKIEHNDFSGLEIQPNARLAWTPNDRHTLWAAISRAVRTPSIVERDVDLANIALPRIWGVLRGTDSFDAENLLAFELGYRYKYSNDLQFDLALFYNLYDDLRSVELGLPRIEARPWPVHFTLPFYSRNNFEATTYGAELAVSWSPVAWWRLKMGYSWLHIDLESHVKTLDIVSGEAAGDTPEQQVFVHHFFQLGGKTDLDILFRYVDSLPAFRVGDYVDMDVRLSWRPREDWEFALVGKNLLHDRRAETRPSFVDTLPTEVERGVYGTVAWRF